MKDISVLGIDLAKNVFQLHGCDQHGKEVLHKRLSRQKLSSFIANLKPCLIGMESCGGSNYWARKFQEMGHIWPKIFRVFSDTLVLSSNFFVHSQIALVYD